MIERSLIPDAEIANRAAAASRLEKPDPKIVYEDKSPETVKSSESIIRKSSVTEKSVPVKETPAYGYEPTSHNSATGERAKALRDEKLETGKSSTTLKNDPITKAENFSLSAIPERLAGQLKVNSNDYKRVALGGIRDLRLTVTNGTAASLAKVVVELQYLKPNEEPLKTEMVSFRGIGPHESSTIRMPDTNRGIKVKYKIVEVVE